VLRCIESPLRLEPDPDRTVGAFTSVQRAREQSTYSATRLGTVSGAVVMSHTIGDSDDALLILKSASIRWPPGSSHVHARWQTLDPDPEPRVVGQFESGGNPGSSSSSCLGAESSRRRLSPSSRTWRRVP